MNFFGVKTLTQKLLPLLRPSPHGACIMNVSSRLGQLCVSFLNNVFCQWLYLVQALRSCLTWGRELPCYAYCVIEVCCEGSDEMQCNNQDCTISIVLFEWISYSQNLNLAMSISFVVIVPKYWMLKFKVALGLCCSNSMTLSLVYWSNDHSRYCGYHSWPQFAHLMGKGLRMRPWGNTWKLMLNAWTKLFWTHLPNNTWKMWSREPGSHKDGTSSTHSIAN